MRNEQFSMTVMRREYDFRTGQRGAVIRSGPGKTRITIRLDNEILAWFRQQAHQAGGANYQSLINQAVREYVAAARNRSRQPCDACCAKNCPASADARPAEDRPLRGIQKSKGGR